MIEGALVEALLEEMERLSPAMQRRVLDFARTSGESMPRGTPGKHLLQFAGIMTPAEADEFLRGIEEDHDREEPISVVRGMIGWVYEKPHAYARTVGEIDSILYCLHGLWAQFLGKRSQYERVRSGADIAEGNGAAGLSDAERIQLIDLNGDCLLSAVLAHWKDVDRRFEQVLGQPRSGGSRKSASA